MWFLSCLIVHCQPCDLHGVESIPEHGSRFRNAAFWTCSSRYLSLGWLPEGVARVSWISPFPGAMCSHPDTDLWHQQFLKQLQSRESVWFGVSFFFWLRPFQCLFFNLKYVLGSARKANQLFFFIILYLPKILKCIYFYIFLYSSRKLPKQTVLTVCLLLGSSAKEQLWIFQSSLHLGQKQGNGSKFQVFPNC